MKKAIIAVALVCLLGCQSAAEQGEVKLESEGDRISYAIGLDIGRSFKEQGVELDPKLIAAGIKDGFAGSAQLTDEEVQKCMFAFQQTLMENQNKGQGEMPDKNQAEGEKFLAENKTKPGVVELPSGLQYKVIREGKGKKPTRDNSVEVHYRGTLIDGKEFDSSYKRGQTITFPVTGVIAGWTEALQLMQEGAKWELYIPSDLAYGPRGAGGDIGPNATLIFEVELIAVK